MSTNLTKKRKKSKNFYNIILESAAEWYHQECAEGRINDGDWPLKFNGQDLDQQVKFFEEYEKQRILILMKVAIMPDSPYYAHANKFIMDKVYSDTNPLIEKDKPEEKTVSDIVMLNIDTAKLIAEAMTEAEPLALPEHEHEENDNASEEPRIDNNHTFTDESCGTPENDGTSK